MADETRQRFEALFEAHARPILGYALRRVDRPEDAADIVSEVMLVAWRRIEDVPDGAEARLWLYGVARGVLSNQHRAARRRTRLGERLRTELGSAIERDHAEAWGEREAVRAALARLDEPDREVLLLTAWEGLAPSEIARALSIAPATARSRLHRALGRLERELGTGSDASEAGGRPGSLHERGHLLARYIEEES